MYMNMFISAVSSYPLFQPPSPFRRADLSPESTWAARTITRLLITTVILLLLLLLLLLTTYYYYYYYYY